MSALPGRPGKALVTIWDQLGTEARDALLPHLLGGTSAERLALILSDEGYRISATTIKSYRRALRQDGERV